MSEHEHHHSHEEHAKRALSPIELRVKELEARLAEKGYIDPAALDVLIDEYQTKIGPRNGARVVARAWCDPEFNRWLLQDATAAIASMGFTGRQGEHMVAVENTPEVHNMVVCTLCSCYPWAVLGLPPTWYKSAPYRARAVKDPRGVLAEFGVQLPESTRIRIWDSTAEVRYLVLPRRPAGTEALSEQQLADLVTRDSMIGTGLPRLAVTYHSFADLGGQEVSGAIAPEAEGELFHAPWEPRVMALVVAMGPTGISNIDMNRSARETLPNYRDLSYYEIWLAALEKLALQKGLLGPAPPAPARVLHPDTVAATIRKGTSVSRPAARPARFAIGDAVRTVGTQPQHHTRLPAYARGKSGIIQLIHGAHVFPDTNAEGLGEAPQWLYTVAFEEKELWGEAARMQRSIISVDAFEPYLEPA